MFWKIFNRYNTFRQQWELPAGKKEANETSKECAIRELYEETGQTVSNINFVGLLKSLNLKNKSIKFNPVYYTQRDELQPFKINEEISEIKIWDLKVPIEDFDEIDYQLFRYL
ncbi:NUDIX hydrolase [Marinilactibacillus sp. GCM10026970]|uniref:NUDIX hydrolase n=1 Tax=Marinilactibacillus sp. GCM10026970 TaxID=3252642 RepID=UPI00360F64C6